MCQIVAYNVANITSKINFSNFFSYINKYDIFFLFETHLIHENRKNIAHFFNNYILHWIDAIKVHSTGRASGGCLYGYKKSMQTKFKFHSISTNVYLSAMLREKSFLIIPRYLNCNNWQTDFSELEAFALNIKSNSFCVIGDLNARMGDLQEVDEELADLYPIITEKRVSKDESIDSKGRRLLAFFDSIGCVVLNGRTSGDSRGEYTFCGAAGSSVIDYCACSIDFLDIVDSFEIGSKHFSDHMPLIVKISFASGSDTKPCSLPNKLKWDPKYLNDYREALNRDTEFGYINSNTCINTKMSILTSKIKSATGRMVKPKKFFTAKQKWFDCQCYLARSRMTDKLNLYRKHNLLTFKQQYAQAKRSYYKLCESKKVAMKNKDIRKLNYVSDSRQWWKLAKDLKNIPPKMGNNLTIHSFFDHFKGLLSIEPNASVKWAMPRITDPLLDNPFEMFELNIVLKNAKLDKAPGSDRIPSEFYKYAPPCFKTEVLQLLNKVFLSNNIPDCFRTSIIIPLYKKGDVNCVSNYRGLSLLDTTYKMFAGLLLNRINSWVDRHKILNEFQAGFRRGYSTVDSIFNLSCIAHLNFQLKKKTYAFFVDFSCAFDLIPRNSLFYKLSNSGLSSKIVTILQLLYQNTSSEVWDGSLLSDSFYVTQGVKQGCPLSPVLFSLYLNDLHDHLPHGLNIEGWDVKLLMYADDIVLLSDCPLRLQHMINALHIYCEQWSLNVNLLKSKVLIFRKSPRLPTNIRFIYGTDCIEIVNEYTYLGVNLTYNLAFIKHLESKLASAKMAINATWLNYIHDPNIKISNKMKIFQAAAKSILFYGAQVWGFTRYEQVEKLLRFFIKKILYLPNNTPNYMINIETGLNSLFSDTLRLHLNYISHVLSLSRERLPRILAEKIIEKNIFWASSVSQLCSKLDIDVNVSYTETRNICIINQLIVFEKNENIENARASQFHDIYPYLRYDLNGYFNDNRSQHMVSLIFQARGGLLNINARAFKKNTLGICTLCNMDEPENTVHFIGVCPIFKRERILRFGKSKLSKEECFEVLNGKCFLNLYIYLLNCLQYRRLLLNEFK